MRLEGRPTRDICDALEIQARTLYIWFSDPLVKDELDRHLAQINELFAERIAGVAMQGLSAVADIAAAPVDEPVSWETKLEAIRMILERLVPPDADETHSPGRLDDCP